MKQRTIEPRPKDRDPLAELFEPRGPKASIERVLDLDETVHKPTALTPAVRSALARPLRRKTALAPVSRLPQPQTLALDQVKGTLTNLLHTLDVERVGTITLTLPFGMEPCIVNAATFKALAGREGDTLLRQAGDRWEIVEDDMQIDLGDRTQLFKMGSVQIYS